MPTAICPHYVSDLSSYYSSACSFSSSHLDIPQTLVIVLIWRVSLQFLLHGIFFNKDILMAWPSPLSYLVK